MHLRIINKGTIYIWIKVDAAYLLKYENFPFKDTESAD